MPVAQLDRVSDSDSEGRKFESCRAYQKEAFRKGGFFFGILVGENLRPSGAKRVEAAKPPDAPAG